MRKKTSILMIGDSITDSSRNTDPEGLGNGYVRLIRDYLWTKYPEQEIEVINRGISGNRVTDLEARWKQDVLELKPDFVSVSIGINDVWRQLDRPEMEQVYPQAFAETYARLLQQTDAGLILMEPTVIEEDAASEGNQKLLDYIESVHRLAEQFGARLVPTHQAFQNYLIAGSRHRLTTDGVHMNSAGNMLMARTWLETCEDLFVES